MPVKIDPSVLSTIDQLPQDQQKEILDLLNSLDEAKKREGARDTFIDFVKYMWTHWCCHACLTQAGKVGTR